MANDNSDYRFIEIIRTVFKAIRLTRRVSLPYTQAPGDETGVYNLISEVRNTLNTMTNISNKELDTFNVILPEGQDIINNGIMLNIELYGVPIIRKINLNFLYKYQQK